MNRDSCIYIAGHCGLVGSALTRKLKLEGFSKIITRGKLDLDLTNQLAVDDFFKENTPDVVILAAARVGGIHANNTQPAEFIRINLQIQTNVIDAAHRYGAKKLLFLGSSCIYPRLANQPIVESSLLTGPLEETNRAYAISKIAGIEMCMAYRKQYKFNAICVMPTNLYGPGDNFDLSSSHVLPALIRKFYEANHYDAKEVVIWGTGSPRREFLYVDDLADACLFLMKTYDDKQLINIGYGEDVSIKNLAELIGLVSNYSGRLIFDETKPDGTPRKLLDITRLTQLGWKPKTSLKTGIEITYSWFEENNDTICI